MNLVLLSSFLETDINILSFSSVSNPEFDEQTHPWGNRPFRYRMNRFAIANSVLIRTKLQLKAHSCYKVLLQPDIFIRESKKR